MTFAYGFKYSGNVALFKCRFGSFAEGFDGGKVCSGAVLLTVEPIELGVARKQFRQKRNLLRKRGQLPDGCQGEKKKWNDLLFHR